MSKIIVIDAGSLTHISIFQVGSMLRLQRTGKFFSNFMPKCDYIFFSMICSLLKKIGISKEDKIVLACDGRNSWRKDYYEPYKANRKELRDSHDEIDWKSNYARINTIIDALDSFSPIHVIRIDRIEADDIQAYIAKKYSDKEVILVTGDKDLEQLCQFSNVKIFSLNIKVNGSKGGYKIIENPYKILEEKIRKGDISDNILVNKETDTIQDYEVRKLIIDLINLPDFVTEKIEPYFKVLPEKDLIVENLPYPNSLAPKFRDILISEAAPLLTPEKCKRLAKRRKTVAKNKIIAKRLAKKQLEETRKNIQENQSEVIITSFKQEK